MLLMKKDMGGAAAMIALAADDDGREAEGSAARAHRRLGREFDFGRRLPAAATSIRARKGLTVEIGNTDAEGRLVLADALALGRRGGARSAGRSGHADGGCSGGARARTLPPFYVQ
jgi:leucyl aminopeptidase